MSPRLFKIYKQYYEIQKLLARISHRTPVKFNLLDIIISDQLYTVKK